MNNLIIKQEDKMTIDKDVATQLVAIENEIKSLKEKEDIIKQSLLNAMEESGIKSLDNDDISITYIFPSDRENFDTKRFKVDHPDLYDEYVKITTVKSSVRLKVK